MVGGPLKHYKTMVQEMIPPLCLIERFVVKRNESYLHFLIDCHAIRGM